uniref:Cep192/Spd-2-like domain-containing protein n=1 Tax=Caenorhabditis japonica TaxID=281687 RepID=A0A8R1DVR5_CAEJA
MEEEPPMSLVVDHFDDVTIDDRPVDGSYYNEEEYEEEEEVQPTSENFSSSARYKPSNHTPSQLPTIREEKDDLRSTNSSRAATRSDSVTKFHKSHNQSDDISSQFQFGSGMNAIEKYTENFYSKQNEAERLFPEHQLLAPTFTSPLDKQNSWEPSVCHYEKQPTPEIKTDSPSNLVVFGHLSRGKKQIASGGEMVVENDENAPRISPERTIFTTSPMDSSKFLDAKTSTPKRPGASNRLGQRALQPPQLELSSIYAPSPQRADVGNANSLFGARPAPNAPSDTMLSNQTISESMVKRVISGTAQDTDLMKALEMARKRREKPAVKPDFRINTRPPCRSLPPSSSTSNISSNRPIPPTLTSSTTLSRNPLSSAELTNCGSMSSMSRLSTAKSMMASSQEDLTRGSATSPSRRAQPRGYPSSTTTILPNSTTMSSHARDGLESVNMERLVTRALSRASSIMTATTGGATSSASGYLKPLKITARRLAFGAVPVNESLTMEMEIENISDRQCHVRSEIDSKTLVYQILDNKMMVIDPGKTIKLRVAFNPTSVGRYQVFMLIEVPAQNFRQKIPIWGIGGVALIQPIASPELQPTANIAEFAMYTNNLSRISLKLANKGSREGFALISVFDSSMHPLPTNSLSFNPSCGVVLKRNHEKRVDIRIGVLEEDPHDRMSSAMSSVSTTSSASTVRRFAASSGANYIIQIAWGEEILRQRLRMLAEQTRRHRPIDGHDFTKTRFADESELKTEERTSLPSILPEDACLFSSTYRTHNIYVFSSARGASAFRAAHSSSSSSRFSSSTLDSADATVLETTAFRQQTFVNDATIMPASSMRR